MALLSCPRCGAVNPTGAMNCAQCMIYLTFDFNRPARGQRLTRRNQGLPGRPSVPTRFHASGGAAGMEQVGGVLFGLALLIGFVLNLVTTVYPKLTTQLGIFGVVVIGLFVAGLALLALHSWAQRRADRGTVRRLLALEPRKSWSQWALPAPESYMLLRGVGGASGDAFKLGLLQLIGTGVLRPHDEDPSKGGRGRETVLRRGPVSMGTTGSLASIYNLWVASPDPTIKTLARRARQEYGSLAGFGTNAVLPELLGAGLYRLNPIALTPKGETARADLESRMAGVLREIQQRPVFSVDRKPRQALMAAVIAVAMRRSTPPEEAELQRVGQQVEQSTAMQHDTSGQTDPWLGWHFFNHFDSYFQTMGSELNSGQSGVDGSVDDGSAGDVDE